MPRLSVYIMAQNEEGRIRSTLESVRTLADELVVIDGGSTDRTAQICRDYTPHVFVHPFEGYAKQRQYALSKVSGDWVLAIDADETLSPELREALPLLLDRQDVDAYEFSRRNYVRPGLWLRYAGMYPDYQRRLFRRQCAHYGSVVHRGEVPEITGRVETVPLDILHDQVQNNIQYHWGKLMNFARAEVKDTPRTAGRAVYVWRAFWTFFLVLYKKFLVQQGYRMGIVGLRVAGSHALLQFLVNLGIAKKPRAAKNYPTPTGRP
jgi:glycosyltransferase involved in cell wall biosynthesis